MRLSASETITMPDGYQLGTLLRLDLSHISTYVSPKTQEANSWDDVPEILGILLSFVILQQSAESLCWCWCLKYDSEIVYHNMREEVAIGYLHHSLMLYMIHSGSLLLKSTLAS